MPALSHLVGWMPEGVHGHMVACPVDWLPGHMVVRQHIAVLLDAGHLAQDSPKVVEPLLRVVVAKVVPKIAVNTVQAASNTRRDRNKEGGS